MEELKNQQNNLQTDANLSTRVLPKLPPKPPMRPPFPNDNNNKNSAVNNVENVEEKHQEIAQTHEKVKSTSQEMPQNDKPLKNKSKKLSKKQICILIVCLVSVLILTVMSVFVAFYIKDGQKLVIPKDANLDVVQINEKTFLYFDEVEGAKKYLFSLSNSSENFVIESENNVIDVSTYFNQPKNFTISVCVQGKDARSKSKPSKTFDFKSIIKLEGPTISYSETENKILFESVENADFYTVYYLKNNVVNSFEVENSGSIIKLDCNFENGNYSVFVVAKSNSDFFSSSNSSNVITINISPSEIKPVSAELNGLILNVTLPQICDYLEIEISDKIYQFQTQNKLSLQIDFSVLKVEIASGTSVYVRSVLGNIKSQEVLATKMS